MDGIVLCLPQHRRGGGNELKADDPPIVSMPMSSIIIILFLNCLYAASICVSRPPPLPAAMDNHPENLPVDVVSSSSSAYLI